MLKYTPVDLHRKKSQVLIVHCSDPRFQAAYRQIIDSLGKYYDSLVVPGASKAIAESQEALDNIKLLHGFHRFEHIHILDHVDCGAFGEIKSEVAAHSEKLREAEMKLKTSIPDITVSLHLVGEKHELSVEGQGSS